MSSYICNILVLSSCSFENTPIIYHYGNCNKFTGKIYIDNATFELSTKEDTICVEIKQIETSKKMQEFIRISLENTDVVVIYGQNRQILKPIKDLIEISNVKTIINITNENFIDSKINNEILKLFDSNKLNEFKKPVDTFTDVFTPTIFGNIQNQWLINFDRWLDRWIFCCINNN